VATLTTWPAMVDCAITPDGLTVVGVADGLCLRVWDVRKLELLNDIHYSFKACDVTSDGKYVVGSSDYDGVLHVYDTRFDNFVPSYSTNFKRKDYTMHDCCFTSDRSAIVTCSDKGLRLWKPVLKNFDS